MVPYVPTPSMWQNVDRREQISVRLSLLATRGYVDQDGARSIRLAESAVCNNSMIFSSLNWEGDP
jgi:hypothetical protein